MSSFRKKAVLILIAEMLMIFIANILLIRSIDVGEDHSYMVDIKRLTEEMENIPHVGSGSQGDVTGQIDLSAYPHIVSVTEYHPADIEPGNIIIAEVDGKLYRMEYKKEKEGLPFLLINIIFGLVLVMSAGLFFYMERKVLRPFEKMSDYAKELAKGNLSEPVRQEKGKYFGRFAWGMDMLRDKLEDDKRREHAYMKDKKTLVLSLSHDIKTPLSAIELYNRALSSGLYDTDEKRAEAYRGIDRNVNELRDYVKRITEASRDDFLEMVVKDGEFYLLDVLLPIEKYYGDKFRLLHTEFYIGENGTGTYDKKMNPLIKGDPDRVVEVFQNLLENAIKYGDGKRVWIDIREDRDEDVELISVHNTGESVPEADREHLFDSFYRGSNSDGVEGSGLGMYIARGLMRKMDGEVYQEPDDEGFAVTVVLKRR